MTWTDVHALYSQLGQTWTVMRPAFVMELYGEGPQLAPHGRAILDRFLELAPGGTRFYCLGNNARAYTALDARSLTRVRKTLDALATRERFYSIKDASECDAGTYAIDLELGSRHATINDTVYVALPLDVATPERLPQTLALFTSLLREFPFWGGVGGYGFSLVWGREFEMAGMPLMMQAALRHHGLLVRERNQEAYAVKKLKSAGWLTFLGRELVDAAGGAASLGEALAAQVDLTSLRDGLLLRAGDRPTAGDVDAPAHDLAPLAAVNRAIAKVRISTWLTHNLFGVPAATANGWLRRFD